MRLLLDSCIWGPTFDVLTARGHDVDRVADWPADPGDEAILAAADHARRILVTLDRDFGEFAVVRGASHSGIIRLVGFRAASQAMACLAALERYGSELSRAIVTVEPGRIRIRLPS